MQYYGLTPRRLTLLFVILLILFFHIALLFYSLQSARTLPETGKARQSTTFRVRL